MNMQSSDMTQNNVQKIADLFPTVVTEVRDADGNPVRAIDFDLLRQELSDHIVEGPQERYRMDWPGKREALYAANAPIAKTLRPKRDESVDFDATENLFIEGDNLDALKLLQESYLSKIKLVYIDPPYNTGNDYIYNDDFAESNVEYLAKSQQANSDGSRLIANPESNGRFHSDWLSMLYPRLKLVRNLMTDDGLIFISIDDGEVANLRKVADQVFGEQNFVANVVWQKKYTRANDARWFSDNHDHLLCYARNKRSTTLNLLPRDSSQIASYSNPDNHPKGSWKATPLHAKSGSNNSSYQFQNGTVWTPPVGTYRRFNDDAMRRMEDADEIWFGATTGQTPSRKSFLTDVKDGVTPVTIWPYDEVGHNHEANNELKKLGLGGLFSNPKPTRLIQRMITLATKPGDVVLDFFAGSSSSAHATLAINAADAGNRKFIMVQLDETTPEKSEAYKEGYGSIAALSRERIRRAGEAILKSEVHADWNKDVGFRTLKIDTTNFEEVSRTADSLRQDELSLQADNIKSDRTSEDLLFQTLLDWGLSLTMQVAVQRLMGHDVFFVEDDAVIACFSKNVTVDLVRQIAEKRPLRAVFRDSAFGTDAQRVNCVQVLTEFSPETEMKCI